MESFEKKLERLEQISQKMRTQETTLQESLQLFEEGILLSNELEEELKSAEQRVEILTNPPSENKEPDFSPFTGD